MIVEWQRTTRGIIWYVTCGYISSALIFLIDMRGQRPLNSQWRPGFSTIFFLHSFVAITSTYMHGTRNQNHSKMVRRPRGMWIQPIFKVGGRDGSFAKWAEIYDIRTSALSGGHVRWRAEATCIKFPMNKDAWLDLWHADQKGTWLEGGTEWQEY